MGLKQTFMGIMGGLTFQHTQRISDTVTNGMGFMGTETLSHKAELQQKTASEV